MPNRPQQEQKQPDQYREDLNPNHMAGQNIGNREAYRPASEIKELVSNIDEFTMDELRDIPVLVRGARLEQGAKYVDLADRDRREITATGGLSARADQWLVPKSETPAPYWNRIVRAQPEERQQ